jgi:hypothetical protein
VFPIVGAQGQTNPFAIYEVVNVTTAMSKDSDSHIDEMLVRITLVSANYADVQNGIGYIRTAFVRMNETIRGWLFNRANMTANAICFPRTNVPLDRKSIWRFE